LIESGDLDISQELTLYGQGLQATGSQLPPNVGVWVTLGGSVLTLLGGLFGAKVQKKSDVQVIKDEKDSFSAVVASVSAGLNSIDVDSQAKMKKAMEAVQQVKVGLQSKVKEALNN